MARRCSRRQAQLVAGLLCLVAVQQPLLSLSAGPGINVITDAASSFAWPDPSEPKYVVALDHARKPGQAGGLSTHLSAPATESLPDASEEEEELPEGVRRMRMTAANGRQYMCTLPKAPAVPPSADELLEAASTDPTATKTPFELLEAMNSLCLYRQEGLWTYEVCYKKGTRQFRHDTSGRGEDFSCGKWPGEEVQDESIQADSSSTPVPIRYVSHIFHEGAKCVLTGAARTSEVRFTCMPDTPDNTIMSIKEFPTCNYVFVVSTPFLCKHPAFKPLPEQHLQIRCVPIALEPEASVGAEGQEPSEVETSQHAGASEGEGELGAAPGSAQGGSESCAAAGGDGSGTCSAGSEAGEDGAEDGDGEGEGYGDDDEEEEDEEEELEWEAVAAEDAATRAGEEAAVGKEEEEDA
ncbi:hypothetical protein HYH03_003402 [Edaphochlamys debaryana]|uniref:MRH domain-containing protein n=1 Tax=Edaphochlamys debaryana TaxID=47281 RepID=A0A836C324_9CHLO|nr:hypothetical protein HYH03_003402 [Edaphochlamys debaryana]|eukprot:KAG2498656.1 hypothetical protein HYH03_003402 [Edaphochlamys debaryana]